jgi:hypothetical protein
MIMKTEAAKLAALPAIFAECCDPEILRYELSEPFAEGVHAWATDGRILVRCPLWALPPGVKLKIPKPNRLAKCTKNFSEFFAIDGDAYPIPSDFEAFEKCDCCGAMTIPSEDPVAVGPRKFKAKYLSLLLRHGVSTLAISPDGSRGRFEGDGFEGILMEMTD